MISRNNNFDLVRLLAALQVVFIHCVDQYQITNLDCLHWIRSAPGVFCFFTISGFLITMSCERNLDNLKKYFKNRVLRIYPALYLETIVWFVAVLLVGVLTISELSDMRVWAWIGCQLTVLQMIWPAKLFNGFVNGAMWTIPVELGFYCLIPIVLCNAKSRKTRGVSLLLMSGISVIANVIVFNFVEVSDFVSYSLLPFLYCFLLGSAMYLYWDKVRILLEGKFFLWLSFYVAYCLIFETRASYYITSMHVFVSNIILACLTISLAFSYPRWGKILHGWDISYGTYIWHFLFIQLLNFYWPGGGINVKLLLTFLLTIIVASLSWKFIEVKALSLKNK